MQKVVFIFIVVSLSLSTLAASKTSPCKKQLASVTPDGLLEARRLNLEDQIDDVTTSLTEIERELKDAPRERRLLEQREILEAISKSLRASLANLH